jgi:hypothetical protein
MTVVVRPISVQPEGFFIVHSTLNVYVLPYFFIGEKQHPAFSSITFCRLMSPFGLVHFLVTIFYVPIVRRNAHKP